MEELAEGIEFRGNKSCAHQWFEIKKISSPPCAGGFLVGVLLACANCELKKELWE